jgi:hypothetical protein
VQVHVKDLLERCLTVGEEQVYALTAQVGLAKGSGESLSDGEHLTAIRCAQVAEPHGGLS